MRATLPPTYKPDIQRNGTLLISLPPPTGGPGYQAWREYERPLWLPMATSGLVLLIACANLASAAGSGECARAGNCREARSWLVTVETGKSTPRRKPFGSSCRRGVGRWVGSGVEPRNGYVHQHGEQRAIRWSHSGLAGVGIHYDTGDAHSPAVRPSASDASDPTVAGVGHSGERSKHDSWTGTVQLAPKPGGHAHWLTSPGTTRESNDSLGKFRRLLRSGPPCARRPDKLCFMPRSVRQFTDSESRLRDLTAKNRI